MDWPYNVLHSARITSHFVHLAERTRAPNDCCHCWLSQASSHGEHSILVVKCHISHWYLIWSNCLSGWPLFVINNCHLITYRWQHTHSNFRTASFSLSIHYNIGSPSRYLCPPLPLPPSSVSSFLDNLTFWWTMKLYNNVCKWRMYAFWNCLSRSFY